jgi:hypothetical protein
MLGGIMSNLKAGSQGQVGGILDPLGIIYHQKPPTPPFLQGQADPGQMPTPQDTDRAAWLQAFGLGGQ